MAVSSLPRSAASRHFSSDGELVRILWLLAYIQRAGRISPAVAICEYGTSLRTYRRDVSKLRAAGIILIQEACGTERWLRYGGFDPLYAESVRLAQEGLASEGYVSGTLAKARREVDYWRCAQRGARADDARRRFSERRQMTEGSVLLPADEPGAIVVTDSENGRRLASVVADVTRAASIAPTKGEAR